MGTDCDCGHDWDRHGIQTIYVTQLKPSDPGTVQAYQCGGLNVFHGGRFQWCQCRAYRPAPCLCGAYDHNDMECMGERAHHDSVPYNACEDR